MDVWRRSTAISASGSVRPVLSAVRRDSFWDYRTDQVSPSGVWGRDIEQATAANGQRETARLIATTARAVAAGVAEPWPAPGATAAA